MRSFIWQQLSQLKRSLPATTEILMGILLLFFLHSCSDPGPSSVSTVSSEELTGLISLAKAYEKESETDSFLHTCLFADSLASIHGSHEDRIYLSGAIGQTYLYKKWNIPQAEKWLLKQRDLLNAVTENESFGKIRNYLDLSFLYFKKQDYPHAESYTMMAYAVFQEQGLSDSLLLSRIFTSLGKINNQVLDTTLAIQLLNKAAQFYPLNAQIPGRNHPWIVEYINHYNNFGPPDSAIYWLEQLRMQNEGDPCGMAEYERLYSIFDLLMDDYAECMLHAKKAIDYSRLCKSPDPYNFISSYIFLSAALQSSDRHEEAIVFLDSALVMKFGPGYSFTDLQTDIFSVSTLASKAEIMGDQGLHLQDTMLVHGALTIYDTIGLLLRHFTKFDMDGFLANKYYNNFYYAKLMEYYSFMYAWTAEEKWLDQIHITITSYKAQSFSREKALFEISRSEAGKNTAFQEFVRNDYELEKLIFEVNHLPFEEKIKRSKELNTFLEEKSHIRKKLEGEHRETYQKMVGLQNISPDELLSFSDRKHTAVINYYIGDRFYNPDKIYVLVASKGKFVFYTLKYDIELSNDIDSIYRIHMFPARQEFSNSRAAYEKMSFHLYQRLVNDFYQEIRDANEVIIIPDEKLHLVSFEALRMKKPENGHDQGNQSDQSYCLIDSLNISYAYSPNRLKENNAELPVYTLKALGMGFSDKETIGKRRLESLAELRSSYLELESIKKYYPNEKAKFLTGFECTKSNFFKYAPSARLIHLSTHGGYVADIRNSGMLYMSEGKGVSQLYQHELRFANICPEILILSACDSGAGELYTEEGMMSIGRIFQAYGTKKVISALWPLTDRASTDLFNTFYENYAKNADANVSLRNAKLKLLHSRTSHSFPGYWAALMLYN